MLNPGLRFWDLGVGGLKISSFRIGGLGLLVQDWM